MKHKKWMHFLTAAVMLVSSLTLLPSLSVSAAAESVTVDGLNYTISGGEATLTGAANSPANLVVPPTVKSVPVTKIEEDAFHYDDVIQTVSIPSSVKAIGNYAFSSCKKLDTFTMAEGVTTLGYCVFNNSMHLNKIVIPKTLTTIGPNCFSNTLWLESQQKNSQWVIVNGLLVDGSTCTASCTIPTSVREILPNAFTNVKGLSDIVIPKHIDFLPDGAIAQCTNLRMVTIGNPKCRFGCEEANHTGVPCCIYTRATAIWKCEYDGIIRGYLGSTAQTYAKNHNVSFLSLGDITGDGKLTADDSNLILLEYLSTKIMNTGKTLTENQRFAADYDLDADITADDASAVLRVYLENMMK